jgi:hypothetical protein
MKPSTTRDLVTQLVTNDIPHIQARLSGLETQGKITIALVLGLVLAVVAGAIAVLVGK